eukprot:Blabericola_migrator_1__3296@NODE_1971_length_3487_cov_10_071637_g1255_i0_p2_GENE_NODE_1971_length_3487_cov_10_071637_g1255_i0NODE_1971_length_3487_cov_10_071637_g1255_i0_p2_ORF_typecomplete_len142_score13_96_NODE_1971_length_3487_cov_10_071637_g1255_i024282853
MNSPAAVYGIHLWFSWVVLTRQGQVCSSQRAGEMPVATCGVKRHANREVATISLSGQFVRYGNFVLVHWIAAKTLELNGGPLFDWLVARGVTPWVPARQAMGFYKSKRKQEAEKAAAGKSVAVAEVDNKTASEIQSTMTTA